MKGTKKFIRPGFRKDRKALEGLPLKLLIVVIIAVVAIGIIMVWLSQIGGPRSIKLKVSPKDIGINSTNLEEDVSAEVTITVTAYDSSNNKLKDVVVTVESKGATVTPSGISKKTNENGTVQFDLTVELLAGQSTGEIKFTGSKSGYNSDTVTVVVYRQ